MKVLLSLAFMCCFIGGIVGAGCDCGPLIPCYHKNKYVVKARVTGVQSFWTHDLVDIVEKRDFKKKSDFDSVYVPRGCDMNFDIGVTYIFMGKRVSGWGGDTLKLLVKTSFIKRWDNVRDFQREFLRKEAKKY